MAVYRVSFAAGFSRGLILHNGKYFHVEEMLAKARSLQSNALSARAAGDRKRAVALYRELIPYLDKLDEHGAFNVPRGLQTQIAKRTIEQLEEFTPQHT